MKKMTTIIMLAGAVVVLTAASGCDVSSSRKQSAAARWEHKMEQVRLETARQSLANGRFEYAQRVLEPCMNSAEKHDDAEKLMAQIQAAHQAYAQLNSYREDSSKERAY